MAAVDAKQGRTRLNSAMLPFQQLNLGVSSRLCSTQTDNALKVRFSATVGEEEP